LTEEKSAERTVRIAGALRHSSVNGPGVRYVLFFQGCPHHCPGCQNPDTWDPAGGTEFAASQAAEAILQTRYLDGVTFSGGDPLFQAEGALEIARAIKKAGLNLWIYTGWTYEQVRDGAAGEAACELLKTADVLVDGPFIKELKSDDVIYRGSSNQRLVDLPRTIRSGVITEASI
jgi:anaerobic ribonucleoside-triphosphate reductase activating protein